MDGRLILSSRRPRCRPRRLFCRHLRRPLRPRLAPVEGSYRQLPSDPKRLSRDIVDVFCSCLMVRPDNPLLYAAFFLFPACLRTNASPRFSSAPRSVPAVAI